MLSRKVFNFIDLHNGEESKERVLEGIKANISFRGSNLWILVCAIVIASVGLNVNSTAVIIGAMLISPLMGPIVGAGFALAIFDFELLKRSGKNLLIATLVSLFVATVYFFFSPFKDTQSEILSRTSPTIYDVLIAFFGGVVGVVALTRVEKGNPIPGVAIATALMPPLCTAGYGLAVGNYAYFFGAFYLYTINCFFICISTFLIIKYLKYKPVNVASTKFEKRIKYGISGLILVMMLPSFYLAYDLLQENKYSQKVEEFIKNEFENNGYTLIYKRTVFNTNPKKIELAFLNKKFKPEELTLLNQKLVQYEISNTELDIKQDTKDLKGEILNELTGRNKVLMEKDIMINNLQQELDKHKTDYSDVLNEIAILFPELKNVSIGKHQLHQAPDSLQAITVLLYQTDSSITQVDTTKIEKWLNQKPNMAGIRLVRGG